MKSPYSRQILLLFAIFLYSLTGFTYQDSDRVLILIGYIDENNFEEFLNHPLKIKHYPQLSQRIEFSIRNALGATSNFDSQIWLKTPSRAVNVTILNANALCPGERSDQFNFRSVVCASQRLKSLQIMDLLRGQMNQFDEFIYIGHSRHGLGLAVGPFSPEYTFKPEFFNPVEVGRLKKIVMASCDSTRLYSYLSEFVELKGTPERMLLNKDLVPMVLREIALLNQ